VKFVGALLACNAVSSVLATDYVWNGRPTTFNDPLNWNGADPNNATSPGGVNVGTNGQMLISAVPPQQYKVGKSLSFVGPTVLLMGDGVGRTTFNFDTAATGNIAVFNPDSDFECHKNWEVKNQQALTPPCSNDVVKIPNDNSYFIQVQSGNKMSRISFGPGTTAQTSCPLDGSSVTVPGAKSTVAFLGSCNNQIGTFPQETCPVSSCTTTSPTVSPTPTTTTPPTTSAATTIPLGSPTPSPTTAGGGTLAATGAAAGTTVVIVVIVVAILIIVAVAVGVIFVVKKKSSEPDRSVQSFENPMYDDVKSPNVGDAPNGENGYMDVPMNNEGVYSEPDDGTFGGYEGNQNQGSGTGYMDVNPTNGGTGYMDVNPTNGDDDDYDSEEDV